MYVSNTDYAHYGHFQVPAELDVPTPWGSFADPPPLPLPQACTIRILHTYVREGAPEPVPLSDECRSLMLATEASSMYIFQRARDEVLEKMGGQKVSVSSLSYFW